MLVLLLTMALGPLAFVSWLDFRVTEQLGKNLAARTRDALTAAEKQKLRLWVDEKAAWVQSRGLQVEQTLRSQAREIERCLASAPDLKTKAYFKEDFKKGGTAIVFDLYTACGFHVYRATDAMLSELVP